MDAAKMKAIFQQELLDFLSEGWKLTDCQIQHPRYKTYVNPASSHKSYLAATYHLRGVCKQTGQSKDKMLYVKAYLGDRSGLEYEKAHADFIHDERALLHIEKYGMIAWIFPFDPGIAGLPKVMDTGAMQRYFVDFLLASKAGGPFEAKDIVLQIINYRPQIRCTYRYDLEMPYGNIYTLYGKTFADDKGLEVHRRISALFAKSKNNAESFAIPRPLGYDPSIKTLWTEGLNGSPLIEIVDRNNAGTLMAGIAKYLADFHNGGIEGLEIVAEASLLMEIRKKTNKLKNAFPMFSGRIAALVEGLAFELEGLPNQPYKLIHGDFHIQQLSLLYDNRIAVFDFDELAMASPLVDLANFCADLYALDLGQSLTDTVMQSFFNAYQLFSTSVISVPHFNWHYKVQLLTRAYRSYIQQKADVELVVEKFLNAAETGCLENTKVTPHVQ